MSCEQKVAAATTIQKHFRSWKGVHSSRGQGEQEQLPSGRTLVAAPDASATDNGRDANSAEVVLAAQRLQREAGAASTAQRIQRWRRYRDAVHSSLQHQTDECCALAAQRIQYHWRRYRRAVVEGGCDERHHHLNDDDEGSGALDAASSGHQLAATAGDSTQWSRASSQGSVHLSTADFDTICDWLDDLDEDGQHDETDDAASVEEQEHVVELLEDLISNLAVSSLRRQQHSNANVIGGNNALSSAAATAASDVQDELGALREAAAVVIQRFVRRRLKSRGGSYEASIPEATINALRVLQNRFRITRLRRIVRERDRTEMARRIQELWRRRQETRSHFVALRRGREEAAARGIQNAYLRYRQRQSANQHDSRCAETQDPFTPADVGYRRTVEGRDLHESRRETADPNHYHQQALVPQCIVCVEQQVEIALLPCGHAQLCHVCSAQLRRCPTCRKVVALQVRIFL